jgi:hypothetical protein
MGSALLGAMALVWTWVHLVRLGWRRHGTAWHDFDFLHVDWVFRTQEPYWGAHARNLGGLVVGVLMLCVAVALFVRSLRWVRTPPAAGS